MSASNPVALSLAFLIPLGFALIATSGWPVERAAAAPWHSLQRWGWL